MEQGRLALMVLGPRTNGPFKRSYFRGGIGDCVGEAAGAVPVTLGEARRLPFTSYDIVVYFGVGILALPFLRGYVLGPLGLRVPKPALAFESPFVGTALEALLVLFAGYALGHIIGLSSSYFVERFLHAWLGYPSDLWLRACDNPDDVPHSIAAKRVKSTRGTLTTVFLTLCHLPLLPFYAAMYLTRSYGFYVSRIPVELRDKVEKRFLDDGFETAVRTGTAWPKILKQYIVNNCPVAYARMSSHRVVFGLLRSLCLLALVYVWIEVINFCTAAVRRKADALDHLWTYGVVGLVATLLFLGFGKFNRRFFEESVYAFVLTRRNSDRTNE